MDQRRAEPRLLCSDLIRVRLEGDQPLDLMANLEDISPSGASLQFEHPIAAGVRISLELGRHRLPAEVQYCIHNEIGYFVGVRFAGQKWSRKLYKPKHMLDPRQLLDPNR